MADTENTQDAVNTEQQQQQGTVEETENKPTEELDQSKEITNGAENPTDENNQEREEKTETTEEDTNQEKEDKEDSEKEPEIPSFDSPDDVDDFLDKKRSDLTYRQIQNEWANNNQELTKETRDKLNALGIDDETIDSFVDRQNKQHEAEMKEYAESVGGKEKLDTLLEWAGKNLSQEEIASINGVRDKNVIKIILRDIENRMTEVEGKTPDYTKGTGGKAVVEGYKSKAQMMAAIRDPRYRVDEAYREEVRKQIVAGREQGFDLGIE